jgi:hypothetical protein
MVSIRSSGEIKGSKGVLHLFLVATFWYVVSMLNSKVDVLFMSKDLAYLWRLFGSFSLYSTYQLDAVINSLHSMRRNWHSFCDVSIIQRRSNKYDYRKNIRTCTESLTGDYQETESGRS